MWGEITCIYNVNCPIWNIIGTFPPIRDILWYMNCTMQHHQLAMPTSQQIPTFNLGNYYQNISPMSGMIMMIHWQRWSGYNNNAIKCEYDIIMKMHDYDYNYSKPNVIDYEYNSCVSMHLYVYGYQNHHRISQKGSQNTKYAASASSRV